MKECCCHIYTDDDKKEFLSVCPMHYGMMLGDSSVDYGLCTTIDANKELNEKYGVPLLATSAKDQLAKILWDQWIQHLKETHPELIPTINKFKLIMEPDIK